MSKRKLKQRPAIQANNAYIRRDEYHKCKTFGCRNIIAVWARSDYCTPCRIVQR